jgi:hypothetical protein
MFGELAGDYKRVDWKGDFVMWATRGKSRVGDGETIVARGWVVVC